MGAILAPGQRTVTARLGSMGLSQEKQFQKYHCVLNRAVWSHRALSAVGFHFLSSTLQPFGTVGVGIDETIERRRGAKLKATGVWGLPFLTVLAPSERYYESKLRGHKKLTAGARQMGKQVRRWRPKRRIVSVADSSYAALKLLDSLLTWPHPVSRLTHLRLAAAVYEPAPERDPHTVGGPPRKGNAGPTAVKC